MLDRKNIAQNNISAGGDVAAGDIINQTIMAPAPQTNLMKACECFRAGIQNDKEKQEFIDRLAGFMVEVESPPSGLRSLEDKLASAQMSQKIGRAKRLKERFAKKLEASSFNDLVQDVYGLIFVEIDSGFEHLIRPHCRLGNNAEAERETHALFIRIEAQTAGYIEITKDDLEGMLYYLAGKCYIDWDAT